MKYIKKGILIGLIMIMLCGFIYPLLMTGIGQLLFPKQSNGSIVELNGKEVGSELIGQEFNSDKYFQGRLSSAVGYNTGDEVIPSSGSNNLGPTSKAIQERITADIESFLKANPTVDKNEISAELLAQSGSGLDPHITVRGAEIQIPRIAKATNISEDKLRELIKENTEGKFLGIYGGERVNVLNLNIELEKIIG